MINQFIQSARLLLVDDETSNVRLLERILRRAGYSDVRGTVDSRDTQRLVDEFKPDLILLDLHMPHMDGFAVLKQLAPHVMGAGYIPVVMLTGDAAELVKERGHHFDPALVDVLMDSRCYEPMLAVSVLNSQELHLPVNGHPH